MLKFIPNAPSTFLWAMSDAHLRTINYFESILFKGLIKPVGKQVNRFVNHFEWFVQFPAARAESSEAVLTQSCDRKFKNIKSVERAAACDHFQEECLCLDTIDIDIFTIFTLAEILTTFVYILQNRRKKIRHLFRYIQMFCSGHVRNFHSFPCQRLYTFIYNT